MPIINEFFIERFRLNFREFFAENSILIVSNNVNTKQENIAYNYFS